MAMDLLAIALEHHRGGRLTQAHTLYRDLLREDPDHAEANQWLGVLLQQAGHVDEGIGFLEKATALSPSDAAYWHNLGVAYLSKGRLGAGIGALDRALAIEPDREQTLVAAALARLARKGEADSAQAVSLLERARLHRPDDPALMRKLVIAQLAAGQAQAAVLTARAWTLVRPEDAEAFHYLAIAQRAAGEGGQTRKSLNRALEIDPSMAGAWYALATLDFEAGQFDIAASLYRKAIAARRDYAAAYSGLGRALEAAGRKAESLQAFAQAMKATRARPAAKAGSPASTLADLAALERKLTDPKVMERHHALAASAPIFSPALAPTDAVANLFDRYADTFDEHLRNQLHYAGPELLAEAIASTNPTPPLDTLDLGCGTGLLGPLLKPIAGALSGVDLSAKMIEKAKGRGVYDHLVVGDLVSTMNRAPEMFDLLAAADSLIYTGDLTPTFLAARKALRGGGLFAFTLEAGGGDRFHLHQETLRFTHSAGYVRQLAAMHGFCEEVFETVALRRQKDVPVASFVVVLRKQ